MSQSYLFKREDISLSAIQKEQVQHYEHLLKEYNKKFNLTALTESADVQSYHFDDSWALNKYIPISQEKGIVDVGSGNGFPGIPLKIIAPNVPITLVEVVAKKREFLQVVVNELKLENVSISEYDWRTFLRKSSIPASLVCARASLRPDELIRMFAPSSIYKDATLVYWASLSYEMPSKAIAYHSADFHYTVGEKERRYLVFKNKS